MRGKRCWKHIQKKYELKPTKDKNQYADFTGTIIFGTDGQKFSIVDLIYKSILDSDI